MWQTRCKHSPDSSPCLHPLHHLTLKHSLPLSLDLTMCLALANRMKEKCDCGTSTSTTQEALLFLVTLSSPRGHVQGGQVEREGHMEQFPTALLALFSLVQTSEQPLGTHPSERGHQQTQSPSKFPADP